MFWDCAAIRCISRFVLGCVDIIVILAATDLLFCSCLSSGKRRSFLHVLSSSYFLAVGLLSQLPVRSIRVVVGLHRCLSWLVRAGSENYSSWPPLFAGHTRIKTSGIAQFVLLRRCCVLTDQLDLLPVATAQAGGETRRPVKRGVHALVSQLAGNQLVAEMESLHKQLAALQKRLSLQGDRDVVQTCLRFTMTLLSRCECRRYTSWSSHQVSDPRQGRRS